MSKNPKYWGTSICKNEECRKIFMYRYSQKRGIYCSNDCQGAHVSVEARIKPDSTYKSGSMRKIFFRRYGTTCEECGVSKPEKHLELHHHDGNDRNNLRENVTIICLDCHADTHNYGTLNMTPEGRNKCRTNKIYLERIYNQNNFVSDYNKEISNETTKQQSKG